MKTKFTADWFEESLANACTLSHTFSVPYRKYMDDCMNALIGIVKDSDEGYRQRWIMHGNYIHVELDMAVTLEGYARNLRRIFVSMFA